MILVDTSVWIEFFRGRDASVVNQLADLLERDEVVMSEFVRIELLAGVRITEIARMERLFLALPNAAPASPRLFEWIQDNLRQGRARGVRFSALDLVIAAQAALSDCQLWSLDSDFKRMADLKWIQLRS